MCNKKNCITLGNLVKEEYLSSLTDMILPNTCVLEVVDPYPGYYHDIPKKTIPKSVFLLTLGSNTRESITRATQNMKKYCKTDFDASFGQVFIYNDVFQCIRLKDLNSYDIIVELQKNYLNEGIVFKKSESIEAKGIIKIKKTFYVNEVGKDLYLDLVDDKMAYFRIPKLLSWRLFENMTIKIRNNWEGERFDAALGSFYKQDELHDIIRIYSNELNIKQVEKIRDMYLEKIAIL